MRLPPFARRPTMGTTDRSKKRSRRSAARPRSDEITTRLSCSFNFLAIRHPGKANCTNITLAKWLCRTADRVNPARVRGPHHCLGRSTSAPGPSSLCRLLQRHQNAPVLGQRCAGLSPRSADRNHQFTPDPWRASSPLRPGLGFWYTQELHEQRRFSALQHKS
jgi:hypothetical protein